MISEEFVWYFLTFGLNKSCHSTWSVYRENPNEFHTFTGRQILWKTVICVFWKKFYGSTNIWYKQNKIITHKYIYIYTMCIHMCVCASCSALMTADIFKILIKIYLVEYTYVSDDPWLNCVTISCVESHLLPHTIFVSRLAPHFLQVVSAYYSLFDQSFFQLS